MIIYLIIISIFFFTMVITEDFMFDVVIKMPCLLNTFRVFCFIMGVAGLTMITVWIER